MNKTNSSSVPAGRNSPMAPLEEGLVKLGIHGKDTQIGEGVKNGESKKTCPPPPAGFCCSLLSGQNSSSAQTLSPLIQYIEEIELFNPAYGLVKVQDRRELIVKHILDSLAPISILRCLLNERQRINVGQEIPSIADVGSGAGLPGIPLAICMPGADFTLIERMGRRAGFLRNTLAVLGLSNARVEETEMENFTPGAGGGFDLVVFRAFRPLEPAIFRGLLKLLAPNGILAAYKGRRESLEQEMAQVYKSAEKGLCPFPGSWEALPLDVPFLNEERHLLLIRQNSS